MAYAKIFINGANLWKDVEDFTSEERKVYESQCYIPSEAQLKARERTEELRDLMDSPAQFKRKLQRLEKDDK